MLSHHERTRPVVNPGEWSGHIQAGTGATVSLGTLARPGHASVSPAAPGALETKQLACFPAGQSRALPMAGSV